MLLFDDTYIISKDLKKDVWEFQTKIALNYEKINAHDEFRYRKYRWNKKLLSNELFSKNGNIDLNISLHKGILTFLSDYF